uniref:SNF2 N-terminal domain-containing protein n=1 Tax=Amphimedon queenslandica TaxID=400682 RepID=A0A1X7SRQ0_AMPQE
SQSAYRKIYEEPIVASRQVEATETEQEIGQRRAQELMRLISMFYLRRTQEINKKYLPPKVESVIFCRPTPLQVSVYHHLLSTPTVRSCLSHSHSLGGSPHLVCISALKKLCNCPSLVYTCNDTQ